ncbi:zinc ribbon domain-containing protein [Egbenema bharatensis]|uniref:zinc ribbon domain-containing protein n=1 Tax=Egbenema bharatensis TaxID=3463334 RepID=UPI003A87B8CA
MAYVSDLGEGQRIYLDNRGQQTIVTLSSQAPGQQQSQQNGFTTGEWATPPILFQTSTGVIIQIETAEGRSYIQVQANGMKTLSQAPALKNADVLPMQAESQQQSSNAAEMKPMQPMEPMQPMKPLKMGDMEMQMNPMQMCMGDMELKMGDSVPPARTSEATTRRFCTQCGSAVTPDDRFCAHCGHQLRKE